MFCSSCGKEISSEARACPNCGHPTRIVGKCSKVAFVILALLLGWLGIHRMYIGDWLLGILYFVFFWTFIPAFVAIIEAIVIGFRKDDPRFE